MSQLSSYKETFLNLGWKIHITGDPVYWLLPRATARKHDLSDYMVRISARDLGAHTAIIAQSGSGKSFFLGRLIEEIISCTKSRCIIFDPNADFRRVHKIQDAALWVKPKYDSAKRIGFLPTESSPEKFESSWSKDDKRVLLGKEVADRLDYTDDKTYKPLKIWWPDISTEIFTGELDPVKRSHLYHCHAFVKALSKLLCVHEGREAPLIERAAHFFEQHSALDRELPEGGSPRVNHTCGHQFKDLKKEITALRERAVIFLSLISKDASDYYISVWSEIASTGILLNNCPLEESNDRLEVIDLPSLSDTRSRLLAVNAVLSTEWDRARRGWEDALTNPANNAKRKPTFLVVDEAHNLIPADPGSSARAALREQFRTVAAEGRKFGLFLILVSQRPDKLDPMVLSECENKALMRISSPSVLELTARTLGLEDIPHRLLQRCLDFATGRALLAGRWAGDAPQLLYAAARRTVEGGQDLPPEWASPDSGVTSV